MMHSGKSNVLDGNIGRQPVHDREESGRRPYTSQHPNEDAQVQRVDGISRSLEELPHLDVSDCCGFVFFLSGNDRRSL